MKKIVLISLFVLLEMLSIFLAIKSFSNKNIAETKEIYEIDKKQFSMFVEKDDGYKEYIESNKFPEGYKINLENSKCLNTKGNVIEGILSGSGTNIIITSNQTVYCYLYFDRKEDGILTLSLTSGTVNIGSTSTFTVTSNSDGELSVISSNTDVATVSIIGTTVTITPISEGTATITVISAETDNYMSAFATYNLTVEKMVFMINGVEYIADVGMTWSEWLGSNYNTTGFTSEMVQTINDSNGNEFELNMVIIGGTVYEVTFVHPVIINVIRPSGSTGSVFIDDVEYTETGIYEGTKSVSVMVMSYFSSSSYYASDAYVYLNNTMVARAQYGASANFSLSLDGYSEVTIEYKAGTSVYNCYITSK